MSITQQKEEPPPACNDKICIGIALVGEDIRVAARADGREVAHGSFPASALGLALAVGASHGREVFLVSAQTHSAASDLARYAEHAI